LQNRSRDLRSCNWSLQHARSETWVGYDQAHMGIVEAESAVLGVLLFRSGVDGSVNRLHQDVWRAAVVVRVIELELDLIPGEHFIDEERAGIRVQVGGNRPRLGLIRQPEQSDVVILDKPA